MSTIRSEIAQLKKAQRKLCPPRIIVLYPNDELPADATPRDVVLHVEYTSKPQTNPYAAGRMEP